MNVAMREGAITQDDLDRARTYYSNNKSKRYQLGAPRDADVPLLGGEALLRRVDPAQGAVAVGELDRLNPVVFVRREVGLVEPRHRRDRVGDDEVERVDLAALRHDYGLHGLTETEAKKAGVAVLGWLVLVTLPFYALCYRWFESRLRVAFTPAVTFGYCADRLMRTKARACSNCASAAFSV